MRPRTGMTLMELVIALAITGMMAAAGAAAFESIIDHRQVIRQASVSIERAGALRETIHAWLDAGNVQIPRGGGPRLAGARGAATNTAATRGGSNSGAVAAAQASGDEIAFTTDAVNPSFIPNVRIRLYVDADANTPEKGLTIEYQPSAQQPLVRKMLDSTIDTLHVDYLDARTNRWYGASQAATVSPKAVRLTLASGVTPLPPILSLPMMFPIAGTTVNINVGRGR